MKTVDHFAAAALGGFLADPTFRFPLSDVGAVGLADVAIKLARAVCEKSGHDGDYTCERCGVEVRSLLHDPTLSDGERGRSGVVPGDHLCGAIYRVGATTYVCTRLAHRPTENHWDAGSGIEWRPAEGEEHAPPRRSGCSLCEGNGGIILPEPDDARWCPRCGGTLPADSPIGVAKRPNPTQIEAERAVADKPVLPGGVAGVVDRLVVGLDAMAAPPAPVVAAAKAAVPALLRMREALTNARDLALAELAKSDDGDDVDFAQAVVAATEAGLDGEEG